MCLTGDWGLRLQHGSHHRSHCEVTPRLGDIDIQTRKHFFWSCMVSFIRES